MCAVPRTLLSRSRIASLLALLTVSATPVLAQQSPPNNAEENVATLPEIQVQAQSSPIASYPGGQIATGSRVGMLGDKDFMETPFSTISYTDKFIADIQAREISDVISTADPTIFNSGMRGELREGYSMRGFAFNSNDVQFGGLHGMVPFYRTSPEMIERIEVLKGPSALINGMPPAGSVGGSVNLVPKRATDVPLARLSTRYMSDAQWGVHTDLGRRFGNGGQFGLRLNAAHRDGEVVIRGQEKKAQLSALALDWRGERVRAFIDTYHSKENINGLNRGVRLAPSLGVPRPPRPDTPLSPTWSRMQSKDRAATVQFEVDISDALSAYVTAGKSKTAFHNLRTPGGGGGTIINAAGDYVTTVSDLEFSYDRKSAQVGFNGRLTRGTVIHQWALNATYYGGEGEYYDLIRTETRTTNIYNPIWGAPPVTLPLMPLFGTKIQLTSYGIADTLGLIEDRLQLTLGVRRQQVETERFNLTTGARTAHYDKSATTPAAAVLVKISEHLSVYANISQGLSEGATAPLTAANAGEVFAPYKTRQKEIGLKTDFGRFTHTVSFFEIKRPNSYTDIVTNIFSSGGEQRNRGVEWSVAGETPLPGLRLLGGAAWLDAKVTRAATSAQEGKQATGAPRIQGKLGVEWDAPFAQGLTLTANASYAAKQYINTDNSLHIPGRTIYDLGARYAANVGGKPLTLRASVTNVTNKAYWGMPTLGGTLGLGEPRTLLLSATMDFKDI